MNEPVAWHYPDGKPDQCTTDKAYAEKDPAWTPMYYKHEWVGLTEEEVFAVSNTIPYADRFEFAKAIEAKLKEKNT
jgi:superfamily I DNA and RNA helicase